MTTLESKHTLFDSVEQMLAPETLSKLLAKPVTQIENQPMNAHSGLAGGQLSYVDTNVRRLVLKRMSINSDWIMRVTEDHQGRSTRLWEYGLLDELLPNVEHKIIASSHDGEGWALLMEDLTGKFFTWENFTPEFVHVVLDALARIHATFWNDPRLQNSQLGLGGAATYLNFYFQSKDHTGDEYGPIPNWCRDGWKAMPELLDAKIFQQMIDLHEHPASLLNAIKRYSFTMLHGDYRAENLAHNGKPVAIDWQQAKCSLMTIDLAWITKHGYIQNAMSEEDAIAYYRSRLESHLGQSFDDTDWQAMVALGYALDALSSTCLFAAFYKMNGEADEYSKNLVLRQGQKVIDVLRWL